MKNPLCDVASDQNSLTTCFYYYCCCYYCQLTHVVLRGKPKRKIVAVWCKVSTVIEQWLYVAWSADFDYDDNSVWLVLSATTDATTSRSRWLSLQHLPLHQSRSGLHFLQCTVWSVDYSVSVRNFWNIQIAFKRAAQNCWLSLLWCWCWCWCWCCRMIRLR